MCGVPYRPLQHGRRGMTDRRREGRRPCPSWVLKADALVRWVPGAGIRRCCREPPNACGGWELSWVTPAASGHPKRTSAGPSPWGPRVFSVGEARGCGGRAYSPHFPSPPRGTRLCAAPSAHASVMEIRNGYERWTEGRPLLSACTTLQKSKGILSVFACST